jgi:uncharacterized protein YdhG (YjbR/CyaY superfamily)
LTNTYPGKGEFVGTENNNFNSIDEYIASFPEHVRKILEELRAVIKTAAPDAG